MILEVEAAHILASCQNALFGYYDEHLHRVMPQKFDGPRTLVMYYHDPKTGEMKFTVTCATDKEGVMSVTVHKSK